MDSGRGHPRQ